MGEEGSNCLLVICLESNCHASGARVRSDDLMGALFRTAWMQEVERRGEEHGAPSLDGGGQRERCQRSPKDKREKTVLLF